MLVLALGTLRLMDQHGPVGDLCLILVFGLIVVHVLLVCTFLALVILAAGTLNIVHHALLDLAGVAHEGLAFTLNFLLVE